MEGTGEGCYRKIERAKNSVTMTNECEKCGRMETRCECEEQRVAKDEFKELCLPLIKYLNDRFHPHTTIIITPTGAELMQGLISTGEVHDFIKE